jgi:hypothetical protein
MDTATVSPIRPQVTPPLESGQFLMRKVSNLRVETFDAEFEPDDEFRVSWAEVVDRFGTRYVQITRVERNETRLGKPAIWMNDGLSWREESKLADMVWQRLQHERRPVPYTAADEFDSRKGEYL